MKIFLYNTLTRSKEEFFPINPKKVKIYSCGPTVYDYAHIGNGRAAVIFGLLTDFMCFVYGKENVQHVRNITDIDDKIINAAKNDPQIENINVITKKYEQIYNEDMTSIGVTPPDLQPRATEYVPQMLAMIAKLIKSGHAYEAEGHVLFHVPAFKEYGKLSRRNLEDMIAGARVEVAPYKKDPADFILWKPSTDDQPGWDSPYGRGRPGWHLECSAMNEALNGDRFDIHGGGEDLMFPHHENEIAQSECAHGGEKYVNYWMHVGLLTVNDGVKMSKSLRNFVTVHELIKHHQGETIRYALISAHYRQPLDWNENLIQQSKKILDKYYSLLLNVKDVEQEDHELPQSFVDALADDLNTPKALTELSAIAKTLSMATSHESKTAAKSKLLAAGKLLGLLQERPEQWLKNSSDEEKEFIDAQVVEMQKAREEKNYEAADAIKTMLKDQHGVVVSITKDSVTWRKE